MTRILISISVYCFWLIISLVESVIICPPPDTYSPCNNCRKVPSSSDTIVLNCDRRNAENLNDSRISDILDTFLKTPSVSPLEALDLRSNRLLTHIPIQIAQFARLNYVDLSDNNITSIEPGAFNFTATLKRLDLSHNIQLSTIAPGAFQGFISFNP